MPDKPIQVDPEEGGRTQITTGPMDEHDMALEASIRLKLDRGEPLDEEEKRFLARLPGARERYPGSR